MSRRVASARAAKTWSALNDGCIDTTIRLYDGAVKSQRCTLSGVIETGVLPSGHPFARIGEGPRVVLSIPGLSFTAEPSKPDTVRRGWKRWLEPIDRHGLTFVDIGRRP